MSLLADRAGSPATYEQTLNAYGLADENAGRNVVAVRSLAKLDSDGDRAIRVNPMPAGFEVFDAMNGGWAYVDAGQLVLYGHGID